MDTIQTPIGLLDHQTKLRANQTALGVPTKGAALFIEIPFLDLKFNVDYDFAIKHDLAL